MFNDTPWNKSVTEVEGMWWPANVAAKGKGIKKLRLNGKLRFEPGGALTLKLYDPDHYGLSWGDNMMHGNVDTTLFSTKVTCLGLYNPYQEGKYITFNISYVLEGFHHPLNRDNCIKELSFSLQHLSQWVTDSGFIFNQKLENQTFTISYKGEKGSWLELTKDFKYKISRNAYSPHKETNEGLVEVREKILFHLRSNKPAAIDKYLDLVGVIVDFFTLSMLDYSTPYNFHVIGDIRDEDHKIDISHANLIRPYAIYSKFNFGLDSEVFLFSEKDIIDDKSSICDYLKIWINNYSELKVPFSLYKSALYEENFAETKFILLSQAIETFHRKVRGGHYIDECDYKSEVFKPLLVAVSKIQNDSLKESLKSALKYGNEISLWKRITELIEENRSILVNYFKLPKRSKDLGRDIADIRNFLTHYSSDKVIKHDYMDFYSYLLKCILELSILRQIGFSSSKLEAMTERSFALNYLKLKAPNDLYLYEEG
ncbi:MAG: HEPN domain-containing protein [Verrucomicrobiota bacterium]